jgi:glycogen phosphorylase
VANPVTAVPNPGLRKDAVDDANVNLGFYRTRPFPEPLAGLAELALDTRRNWRSQGADALWSAIDAELWEATANPWLILESVSDARLLALAGDAGFREELEHQLALRADYLGFGTWFDELGAARELGLVAYFCMEFALSEALPIYSGGLGILAGDHLKAASDLGVPIVGIGLLYQQGYFRQSLDVGGEQVESYPFNDPAMLPVRPLRTPSGEWLRITVELPGRVLNLKTWWAQVGRSTLYLLDTNDPRNAPGDRAIVSELYGGGPELRVKQEIVLGIGGARLLEALGLDVRVFHLNEGHTAFAALERARGFMERTGQPFKAALRCTQAGNIFTSHTPVTAGFDEFPPELFAQYFGAYGTTLGISLDELLALGRADPDNRHEPFNTAYLAMRCSNWANGVSLRHGETSRRVFAPLFPRWPEQEVPVSHVTNGIHMPSWDSMEADELWTREFAKTRWLSSREEMARNIAALGDDELWEFRCRQREALLDHIRKRLDRQRAQHGLRPPSAGGPFGFDANSLTIGFARRFTAYKRPTLLLSDPKRLTRLLTHPNFPIQLVVAGKAHPRDEEGKHMVREWTRYIRRPEVCGRAVFLEDYDLQLAAKLVQGVDLWTNMPRRPWEACGTSGMKVLVNGGLNLSVLDGWWAEAYSPEVGWAVGSATDSDPTHDAADAEELYRLLEEEVIPTFYNRDVRGIPIAWVARMRASMSRLAPQFSSNRMVREYTSRFYLPCAREHLKRSASNGSAGARLQQWIEAFERNWTGVRFGNMEVHNGDRHHFFQMSVYLGGLDPKDAQVELYAEPLEPDGTPERHEMTRGEPLPGSVNGHLYTATVPDSRPQGDYSPRIVPNHPDIAVPIEIQHILWS